MYTIGTSLFVAKLTDGEIDASDGRDGGSDVNSSRFRATKTRSRRRRELRGQNCTSAICREFEEKKKKNITANNNNYYYNNNVG